MSAPKNKKDAPGGESGSPTPKREVGTPLMSTVQGRLLALNQQLSAMTREISLSAPLRNVPGRIRSALAKKLEAEERGVEAIQPFGLSAATRRKLTEAGKREYQLIRADLTQFLKTPVPHDLAELRAQTVTLRQLAPRRFPNLPWAIQKGDAHIYLLPQDVPSGPVDIDLTPPAVSADPARTSSTEIGELNLKVHSTGMGGAWGLEAAPGVPSVDGALRFAFTPSFNASLYATAQVDVAGTIYLVAHDHWYTSTDAYFTMRLGCRLYQYYLDSGFPLTIASEHHWDSSTAYWLVNTFTPFAKTTVEAGTPLIVEVWASLDAYGRSDHAWVDADFATGPDKYIRVPRVTLTLVPL